MDGGVTMAVLERTQAEAVADLHVDADTIYWRINARYNRSPEKRQEARLEMPIADELQRRRDALLFMEFSSGWVGRSGELP
jgi:hypothetical protein